MHTVQIYGTIGPSCADTETLQEMFRMGMTGVRLNTSHVSVREAAPQIRMIREAAEASGKQAQILIDMQGPELRIGKLAAAMDLKTGQRVSLQKEADGMEGFIPIPEIVSQVLEKGREVLLDDGRIQLEMIGRQEALVKRGGVLTASKSIALPGLELDAPAMTAQDASNIRDAVEYGVTAVMQPFVRSAEDLRAVRTCMDQSGGTGLRLLAKIENMSGVEHLENFFGLADEIVIARGDLGNAMPLWELPKVQQEISACCREAGVPFMVVTQMLSSMEHRAVPTRAEVNDIYHAVCDGAASVMVTGETAVGEYPVEVIRYLARTVETAQSV